jgi:hypothetical protein
VPLATPPAVETNSEVIVRAIGQEAVDVYCFLRERISEVDPAEDRLFQFLFRSFYRLDNAGLTDDFKTRFFQLLQAAKCAGRVDIIEVVRDLWAIRNRKGQKSIQYSFATKLAATVDENCPIYDAEVAAVFGFRPPYTYRSFERRLAEYSSFHADLTALYNSIVETNRLIEARALFRTIYGAPPTSVSETKVLDFIFWSAGKLMRE